MNTPFEWQRGPRSSFALGPENGVYALFLRNGAALPDLEVNQNDLIYIGLAAGRDGMKGRCHFDARTHNHSPRKSLAALLKEELSLTPVLVTKPNAYGTWGLDRPSDARLTAWMHANLELAIEVCSHPNEREKELISRYAPSLNLRNCVQTTQHRQISLARASIMAELQVQRITTASDCLEREHRRGNPALAHALTQVSWRTSHSASQLFGANVETAEVIAARYRLNPKSYRQRLRNSISWYRKPQEWSFPIDSCEWRDMIAVAEKMAPGSKSTRR
jgi:hypothetical protein